LTLNSRSGIRTEDLENVDSRATAFVTYIPQRDVRTRLQRCGDFAKLRVLEFLVVRYYVRYRVADRFARRAIDHATAVCPCISIYRYAFEACYALCCVYSNVFNVFNVFNICGKEGNPSA